MNGEPEGNDIARWASDNGLAEEESVSVAAPGAPDSKEYAKKVDRGGIVDYKEVLGSGYSYKKALKAEADYLLSQDVECMSIMSKDG